MHKPGRLLLRFMVILIVLALIPVVLGPRAPKKNSPYLSALSDLAAAPAWAAKPAPCSKETCVTDPETGQQFCGSTNLRRKCVIGPLGGCHASDC